MWGNDVHGDCVTAEEAFAKACNNPEIFISDNEVISWASAHGVLEGAYLSDVLKWMQKDGFQQGGFTYDDGPYFSVDWTNSATLQSAISSGPVKIGVAADQLESAWKSTGGHTGWFGVGFQADSNEDHCVSLCGYGTINWLAQQLNINVPGGLDGTKPGYALFTWDSIGIIDLPSLLAITQEAWLRQPTTVTTGTSPSTAVGTAPGALILYPGDQSAGKFFMGTTNGHLFENEWDETNKRWQWTDHGAPPGTAVATAPGALILYPGDQSAGKLFMGATNGHLFENYWDETNKVWAWTDHGAPPARP
jgi:hypothetical protein